MKRQITEEEYQEALERLLSIDDTQNSLKNTKPTNLELMIYLTRYNNVLEHQVQLTKKKILSHYSNNKHLYLELEEKINLLIMSLNSCNEPIETSLDSIDIELQSLFNNHPELEKIKELIAIKKANNLLLKELINLQNEKEELLTLKSSYEKQNKKQEKANKKEIKLATKTKKKKKS